MDRSFIGSKNRYALLSEAEDMDTMQVVEQSVKKISLEGKADSDVSGSHPGQKEAVQNKAKVVPPSKPGVKSRFTTQKDQRQDAMESQNRNEPQLTTLPEKVDDWTETQAKDKVRPRKGRGGLARRDLFNDRGKREYDRLSGSQKSGVKPVEKRDGGGARNWGRLNDNYEILRDDDQTAEVAMENAESKESKAVSKTTKADDGPPKQMTLDEWKEQTKGAQFSPSYNLRKAGEGTDETQWGKFHMLKKKTLEDPSHEEASLSYSNQPKMPAKTVKSLNALFPEESFSSHQGRQPGRSGKYNVKSSDAIQQSAHVKETPCKACSVPKFDESEFPSLGGP